MIKIKFVILFLAGIIFCIGGFFTVARDPRRINCRGIEKCDGDGLLEGPSAFVIIMAILGIFIPPLRDVMVVSLSSMYLAIYITDKGLPKKPRKH